MREPNLTDNAAKIFNLRYSIKDDAGNPTETPGEAIKRVAENVAIPTILYGIEGIERGTTHVGVPIQVVFPLRTAERGYYWNFKDWRFDGHPLPRLTDLFVVKKAAWRKQATKYANAMTDLVFIPNSPTWTGAGTGLGQLAACFVLPIADDLGRGRDSIFETMKVAALIQQTGGGNGFDFSSLRPAGSVIKASMGHASGPVSFLKVYDSAFGQIQQGGSRRGANMGILRVDHPTIDAFIDAKIVEGEIANFNISVALTDDFMDAVIVSGVTRTMKYPMRFDGQVVGERLAFEVWDRIIDSAWKLGDPGCVFIDRANKFNPCPHKYVLAATNPCGEQFLPPYSNCCLGHVSVDKFANATGFDWNGFRDAVHIGVQFLDDVVDANRYVEDVPELEAAAMGERRIGLGVMGLADALLKMGFAYDEDDGRAFVNQLMEAFRYHAMKASIERAKERGPFGWIKGSIYDPENVTWAPPKPSLPFLPYAEVSQPWHLITEGLQGPGIRNACQTTVAPTGTTSNVAGLEGSGIEPLFALVYTRTVMQEGQNLKLDYLSPLFADALAKAGITDTTSIIEKVIANGGSCQGINEVPASIRRVFKVAGDIAPLDHVKMQAICQQWIDNAISKTINMPYEATREDVAEVYRKAYEWGCKGITIYRQGSRELEVLSTGKVEATPVLEAEKWPMVIPVPLPDYMSTEGLPTRTFEVETGFGPMQVYVTEMRDYPGRPFDVRIQIGKAGNDKNADVEAIGRALSTALRCGASVSVIVDQLEGIGGATSIGFGPFKIRSAADAVGKLLRRLYVTVADQGLRVTVAETGGSPVSNGASVCPACHNATLVYEAGCAHCDVRLGGCGNYSACD